ncbi:MFS domain-containing protein [Mycena indigotica]|uniref:MFS domain-containing protein n=1 Tax=Mycena indigotica TaxID=2126181 RepID=A0A8H6W318_9AGAR|nr:MFS domain-containing protein [Mycena indigotica]KAF7301066.1 MFS domain-containing protein [Mycena indigotica]
MAADETQDTKREASSPSAEKHEEEPFSIYTGREKWLIVSLVASGTLFRPHSSPLSANLYFPAILTIAVAFHKSTELINSTVTLNMVFQGISPMFWGPLADTYGRRLMFISCLVVLALSCVGLAMTPTSDYWVLLFLRCFQAAGSASTVAIGAGVITDISTRAERGGFYGVYSLGPLMGPAVWPVIGGALSDKLGWRAIFWFLCIAAGVCAMVLALYDITFRPNLNFKSEQTRRFLPETLMAVVGNGSVPGNRLLHTPIIGLGRRNPASHALAAHTQPGPRGYQNPLPLFLEPDIDLILFVTAVVYAVFHAVLASISSVFHETSPLRNQTKLGLCFLGMSVSSLASSSGAYALWSPWIGHGRWLGDCGGGCLTGIIGVCGDRRRFEGGCGLADREGQHFVLSTTGPHYASGPTPSTRVGGRNRS